jgi:hypothetical protein
MPTKLGSAGSKKIVNYTKPRERLLTLMLISMAAKESEHAGFF